MLSLWKVEPRLQELQVLEFEVQKVFPEAKIYFPKINIPFEPSQRNYLKFLKVNDAIEGLPYHHYILTTLPTSMSAKFIVRDMDPFVVVLHKAIASFRKRRFSNDNNLVRTVVDSVLFYLL